MDLRVGIFRVSALKVSSPFVFDSPRKASNVAHHQYLLFRIHRPTDPIANVNFVNATY
jgi:hypothetical protein